MELVYLWVEDYKNIKNEGFNFSPRFDCKFYDELSYNEDGKLEDNCKLEINPKEHTSIFPDNINITAIVGENGSGKSSLIKLINTIDLQKKLYSFIYRNSRKVKLNGKNLEDVPRVILFPLFDYSLSFGISENYEKYIYPSKERGETGQYNIQKYQR